MPIPHEIVERIRGAGGLPPSPTRPPVIIYPDNAERAYLAGLRERLATQEELYFDRLLPEFDQEDRTRPRADNCRMDQGLPQVIQRELDGIPVAYGTVWTPDRDQALIDSVWENTNDNNLFHTRNAWGEVLAIDPILDEPWLADSIDEFRSDNVNLISSVNETLHSQISEVVRDAWGKGWRAEKLAKYLEQRFKVADSRARLIARDQVAKLNGQLTQLRQEAVGVSQYIWRTSLDERVRDTHKVKEGQTFNWKDPPEGTGHPGQDYQCVTPDIVVQLCGHVDMFFQRYYHGPLITVTLSSGPHLKLTPNHPVLTSQGWVKASDLMTGQQLISESFLRCLTGHEPTIEGPIGHLVDLMSSAGRPSHTDGHPSQFHGDGSVDYVLYTIRIPEGTIRHHDSPNGIEVRERLKSSDLNGHLRAVSSVTEDRYSGYVYNLSSDCGYYIASGVVISNCRCFAEPDMEQLFKDLEDEATEVELTPKDIITAKTEEMIKEVEAQGVDEDHVMYQALKEFESKLKRSTREIQYAYQVEGLSKLAYSIAHRIQNLVQEDLIRNQ